jgi:hypothetical protein
MELLHNSSENTLVNKFFSTVSAAILGCIFCTVSTWDRKGVFSLLATILNARKIENQGTVHICT